LVAGGLRNYFSGCREGFVLVRKELWGFGKRASPPSRVQGRTLVAGGGGI